MDEYDRDVSMGFQCPSDLMTRLKLEAEETDRSMGSIIRSMLKERYREQADADAVPA